MRASVDELDVSAIARKSGGGGHRQAAGFSSEASIEEITPGRLRREIRRGRSAMNDEVELVPNESLRIRADAAGLFAGSTLTIRIEEPAPEALFVRFTYELCGLADLRDEEDDATLV